MPRMNKVGSLILGFAVLAGLIYGFSAGKKSEEFAQAAKRATDISDISASGPVEVQAVVHLQDLKAGPVDGSYRYTQNSKDEFTQEIVFPTFRETRVKTQAGFYVQRSGTLEPLIFTHIRALTEYPVHATIPARMLKSLHTRQDGQPVSCYGVLDNFNDTAICFADDSGALVTVHSLWLGEQNMAAYSEFLHDGDHLFPAKMQMFHDGKLLLELDVKSISHAVSAAPDHQNLEGFDKRPVCKNVNYAEWQSGPQYYWGPNMQGKAVTIIGGTIDDHGRVGNLELQQSSDPKFDDTAVGLLKGLHVRPTTCDERPVPSFFTMKAWPGDYGRPNVFFFSFLDNK